MKQFLPESQEKPPRVVFWRRRVIIDKDGNKIAVLFPDADQSQEDDRDI